MGADAPHFACNSLKVLTPWRIEMSRIDTITTMFWLPTPFMTDRRERGLAWNRARRPLAWYGGAARLVVMARSCLSVTMETSECQSVKRDLVNRPYCKAMRIGIMPWPSFKGRRAFPMTDPNALSGSAAFIACPGVGDVVSKSPTSIGEY